MLWLNSIHQEFMRLVFLNLAFYYLFSPLCLAQKQPDQQVSTLKKQIETLNLSLSNSKTKLGKLTKENLELKQRLEALGLYQGTKDEKLIQAISDSRILSEELNALRVSSEKALLQIRDFSKIATTSDPAKRASLEVALKQLESNLTGINLRKNLHTQNGNLTNAKVISIDSQSGMLVLNIGNKDDCAIGMRFTINRGERNLGTCIVAEVRKNVAGVLIISKANDAVEFRVGDKATVLLDR